MSYLKEYVFWYIFKNACLKKITQRNGKIKNTSTILIKLVNFFTIPLPQIQKDFYISIVALLILYTSTTRV